MILPLIKEDNPFDMTDKKCFRIVFDGLSAKEPIIGNLVEKTGLKVNILSANTKSVGGVGYGQMIIEVPKDPGEAKTVISFLKDAGVAVTEVEGQEVTDT